MIDEVLLSLFENPAMTGNFTLVDIATGDGLSFGVSEEVLLELTFVAVALPSRAFDVTSMPFAASPDTIDVSLFVSLSAFAGRSIRNTLFSINEPTPQSKPTRFAVGMTSRHRRDQLSAPS